jgi:transposase
VPATPENTITPRREIKNYQIKSLINLRYTALGMGRGTVYGWLAKYREGGREGLRARPVPGRAPSSRVSRCAGCTR